MGTKIGHTLLQLEFKMGTPHGDSLSAIFRILRKILSIRRASKMAPFLLGNRG